MAEKISIIGCGPGSPDYLTPLARKRALEMNVLAGASRLLDLFPEFTGSKIHYTGTAKLFEAITAAAGRIGILVSGDTAYYSLAESVINKFGIAACEVIPGISSIQVALARLGLAASTAKILSAHAGIPETSPQSIATCETIIILGGNASSSNWIKELTALTAATHTMTICINLTLDDEAIITPETDRAAVLEHYLDNYSRLILVLHNKV